MQWTLCLNITNVYCFYCVVLKLHEDLVNCKATVLMLCEQKTNKLSILPILIYCFQLGPSYIDLICN